MTSEGPRREQKASWERLETRPRRPRRPTEAPGPHFGGPTGKKSTWPAAEAGPLEVFDFEYHRHMQLSNTLCSLLKQGAADI